MDGLISLCPGAMIREDREVQYVAKSKACGVDVSGSVCVVVRAGPAIR